MSTSILYHGFGIREVEYQKTEYQKGKTIFHIHPAPKAIYCATCHSQEVIHRGKKERSFRCVSMGNKIVEVVCTLPRVYCEKCGELRQIKIPFADPKRRYTRSFERWVLDLCQSMTILDVAKHVGVSWDVVKEIQKRYLTQHFAKPKLKHLRRIAIDEIAIAKGHKYATVVLDLESGAIVFVGQGKGAEALKPFWKRLHSSRARIEAVAVDMSPAYHQAVTTHLPKAVIVVDHFHVMKLFNDRISQYRREVYSKMKLQTERDMIKGIRWLLLKNRENLDPQKGEKERLEEALRLNTPLTTVYYLKEDLRLFWECWDYAEAKRFLQEWMAEAIASGIRMLYGMAKTLERHQEELLNYYRYPISTGPLEGTNNKIKTMKRQAYGFRDYEFFKLKIMSIHQCKYSLVG